MNTASAGSSCANFACDVAGLARIVRSRPKEDAFLNGPHGTGPARKCRYRTPACAAFAGGCRSTLARSIVEMGLGTGAGLIRRESPTIGYRRRI
jgi:hypothetical protein